MLCLVPAGEALGGARVGMVVTAQLLPIGHAPPPAQGSGPVPQGHVVCRISLRSTDASLAAAVAAAPARWIAELFGRTMVDGVDAGEARKVCSLDHYVLLDDEHVRASLKASHI